MNDHLSGKELFIRFTESAFRKLLSVYVFNYFPFGFEDRMWDMIVSVPDHCLSFYFVLCCINLFYGMELKQKENVVQWSRLFNLFSSLR